MLGAPVVSPDCDQGLTPQQLRRPWRRARRTPALMLPPLIFVASAKLWLAAPGAASEVETTHDVLVYGSTPGGIIAAVSAARHGATTALLSQREHIGGVCTGGLGQTDIGSCADEVIGGLALEFFHRNAASYPTLQPRSPWNLEPHVARQVFLDMLRESNITMLKPAEVDSVTKEGVVLRSVTTVDGTTYTAKYFVDASYEGDLIARAPGVSVTYGRESKAQYNESGAGSHNLNMGGYGLEYIDPLGADGLVLPYLLKSTPPLQPDGRADKQVQAYNFRLCVTNNDTIRVPFTKPPGYNSSDWELLRRFWRAWPTSKSVHRAAQAQVPTAILGSIPSSNGAKKFDANNCGYNPIHTDMIGGSWEYPTANYTRRRQIWQAHVSYTKGFLWFMSSDESVPESISQQFATSWGYCGDEFFDTEEAMGGPHFPPQLYVREARRLVGDQVFTQVDALNKTPRGNLSIGMGCYNFDSHCEERYACDPETSPTCTMYNKTYLAVQCGTAVPNPGVYQMPLSVLLPKRTEVSNLLSPVCSSASHVAYATLRMEPQFMILGEAAGLVAALSVQHEGRAAVQDVDTAILRRELIASGAKLDPNPPGPPQPRCQGSFAGQCIAGRCIASARCSSKSHPVTCAAACKPLKPTEWLAIKGQFLFEKTSITVLASPFTWLKKSELISGELPAIMKKQVHHGQTLELSTPPTMLDSLYWVVDLEEEWGQGPIASED